MNNLYVERAGLRHKIDTLISVKMSFWNPFSYKPAKLIDFSLAGFRLEFIQHFELRDIEKIALFIPLEDITPEHKSPLKLNAHVKWFDPLYKQVGGTYILSQKREKEVLDKIIIFFNKDKFQS